MSSWERLRSHFHIAHLLGAFMLLSGCSAQFGPGIAELPSSQGWQPLPIGSWVLNDGIEARSMVFCPRDACARQGFASVVAFSGQEALRMEQALKADPASLAGIFSKAPLPESGRRTARKPAGQAKSTTTVSGFEAEGANGILVTIRAKDASGKSATTAILQGREGDRLVIALAVAQDAEVARRDAIAAWHSR